MEKFEVTILGCGCAKPTSRHFPSSQIVNVRDKLYLVDCGEGCQMQICRAHLSYNKINHVFISHLHGDHCLGLIPLISTMELNDRIQPLHVYAPAMFETIFRAMIDFFCHSLSFDVVFHGIDTTQTNVIFEDRSVMVTTIPLSHRVPCCGFLFEEKPLLPHIRREMIDFYHIPFSQINNIKAGADWVTDDGEVIPHERLTIPAAPPRRYAYCSDTGYMPSLSASVAGVDLLYHEATYAEDYESSARVYAHSTARQAALVAREAGVKRLMIGHFSARYLDESVLLQEAVEIFHDTILAKELETIPL
ncbi:MAG: ribonuclease Z [Prevotella sp.]|nr:ribonuclease Z [Prevotella sp.]